MTKLYLDHIAETMNVKIWQIENCISLFEEGATIPFISRYRKERTGALDETQVAEVRHWYLRFEELEKRKQAILKSIEEQGKLTDSLREQIELLIDPQVLEDIYLPYRPKRRTRASIAKEKGLEPLAEAIFNIKCDDPQSISQKYIGDQVTSDEEALAGANDIMAEWISESQPFVRTSVTSTQDGVGWSPKSPRGKRRVRRHPSTAITLTFRNASTGYLHIVCSPF